MKIYTSYYGNVTKLINNKIVPVGISRFKPRWFNWYNLTYVAPSADLLKRHKNFQATDEQYVKEFNEMLLTRDRDRFLKNLEIICSQFGDDYSAVALVCYCGKMKFCHRHLVANWLKEAGIEVEEWEE